MHKKASSIVLWNSFSQFSRILSQAITIFVLTKFIKPYDFGLMAIVTVMASFILNVRDGGITSLIIQRKKISKDFVNLVFWINTLLSLLFYTIFFFLRFFFADFFNELRLIEITPWVCLIFIASSLSIVQQSVFERNLQFRFSGKAEIISTFISSIISVWMAINQYGIYSLIASYLITPSLMAILYFIYSDWRPSLNFSKEDFYEVIHYLKNFSFVNIFIFFTRNLDSILVGRFLGVTELGYYSMASKIAVWPIQTFYTIFYRSFVPLLSKIKNNSIKFKRSFLKINNFFIFIVFPFLFFLIFFSEDIIFSLLGSKWLNSVSSLRYIAIFSLFQSVGLILSLILFSLARIKLMVFWNMIYFLVNLLFSLAGVQFGIEGLVLGELFAFLFCLYGNFLLPINQIKLRLGDYLNAIKPIFLSLLLSILITSLIVSFSRRVFENCYLILGIELFSFIFLYLLIIYLIAKDVLLTSLTFIRKRSYE